jgi:hypothetical protein
MHAPGGTRSRPRRCPPGSREPRCARSPRRRAGQLCLLLPEGVRASRAHRRRQTLQRWRVVARVEEDEGCALAQLEDAGDELKVSSTDPAAGPGTRGSRARTAATQRSQCVPRDRDPEPSVTLRGVNRRRRRLGSLLQPQGSSRPCEYWESLSMRSTQDNLLRTCVWSFG